MGAQFLPAAAAPAANAPGPLAPALYGTASGGQVIVVLRNQFSGLKLRARGKARVAATRYSQDPVVSSIKSGGGTGIARLVSVNAVAAKVSAAEVAKLRRKASVKEIVPDLPIAVQVSRPVAEEHSEQPLSPKLCPSNPHKPFVEPESLREMQFTAKQRNPDQADRIANGKGVIVAIDGMNELAGNPDLIRPDGSHVVIDSPTPNADASDDEAYGDATSVAGQGDVVYDYSRELPFSGLPAGCTFVMEGDAPGSSLIDASLVDTPADPDGFMHQTESQVIQGIDNAVIDEHADVISESFGFTQRPGRYSIFYASNDAAVAAGVTVVVSSGDSGDSGTMSSPSTDPLVIEAGATNSLRLNAQAYGFSKWINDNVTPLSSGGVAPNNRIVDLVAEGYGSEAECNPAGRGCPANTTTEAFGGTSESAPLIAGAAADVIEAYANSHGGTKPTPAMVKAILTGTARDVDAPSQEQGAGLVNIYKAVRAAQQMPGTTISEGNDAPALIPTPTQLDITADGGTTSSQSVTLYNASQDKETVSGTYRELGPATQIGQTVTEAVSAPDPSLPVPAEGAVAAAPITFKVPKGLDRLNADLIIPDPTNGTILSFNLIAPHNRLATISYDFGTPSTRPGVNGTVSNIQHVEVANPAAGTWTAQILWANGRSHLQSPPNVPGPYRGNVSFRVSGQHWITSPAFDSTTIAARSSATIPLNVSVPAAPGDHPESLQVNPSSGPTISYPVNRRTLIPQAGGEFDTTITSSVGRQVGQISTFNINVPAGENDLDVSFSTPDASPDNPMTFWLVSPAGTVVAEDGTPSSTDQGATPVAKGELITLSPAPGRWEIDVELNLTESGLEFTQLVTGNVSFDQVQASASGLPASAGTTLTGGGSFPVSVSVTNNASVGRSFTLRSSAGDIAGGAASTAVFIPAGGTGTLTTTITPNAAASTVVSGTLSVISNTSVRNQSQTIATFPYTYTVG
ncbi:MAG TPA: S8 family serine peptidase [Streptosporangiaceae bacterium]|nr:S8 family serine peptidase [Streptosporangiaceae bacterium]